MYVQCTHTESMQGCSVYVYVHYVIYIKHEEVGKICIEIQSILPQ